MAGDQSQSKVLLLCAGTSGRFGLSVQQEMEKPRFSIPAAELKELLDTPKPLLDVGGRPLVEHVMRSFITQGFDRFTVMLRQSDTRSQEVMQDLRLKGYNVDMVVQRTDVPILKQLSALSTTLGRRFFMGLGVDLNDADMQAMMGQHLDMGSRITSLYNTHGRKAFAGVSIIESEGLRSPDLDRLMTQRYLGLSDAEHKVSHESSLWGYLDLSDPFMTGMNLHVRSLADLVTARDLWSGGRAFWKGAYTKSIERMPVDSFRTVNPKNRFKPKL